MDAKKLKNIRLELTSECERLIKSINRGKLAAEEIQLKNTEDEGDLATMSQGRDILFNLHESDFARLRFIEDALKAMDRGQYGECVRCGENINEKRLAAVPWAKMCIGCQEQAEAEHTSTRMVPAGLEAEAE